MVAQKTNPFINAKKLEGKLKLMLMGPSGSGKTWTTLEIATQIAELEKGRIAVIDTEGGSANLYAAHFDFDILTLRDNYNPEEYIRGMQAAISNGYKVLVIDSFSQAWNGTNGVLEVVDQTAQRMGGNDWAGWSKGRPLQNRLVNAVLNIPIHLLSTARSKTEWAQETGRNGKLQPVKVGVGAVQSSEFEYEFTIAGLMNMEHQFTVTKSKCAGAPYGEVFSDSSDFVSRVYPWLKEGIEDVEGKAEFEKLSSPPPSPASPPSKTGGTKKTAGETWLNNNPAKTRLQQQLSSLGYAEADMDKWLKKLGVARFGEFVGTEAELYKRLQTISHEIAAETPPATPKGAGKTPAPTSTPPALPNPVVCTRVKYVEQGNQKYLLFATDQPNSPAIRYYGRSSSFKGLVGEAYYEANKFDDMGANEKVSTIIDPVEITWEDKGKYLNGKDARPVNSEPLGDLDIDTFFNDPQGEADVESEGEIPPLPEDAEDIPF